MDGLTHWPTYHHAPAPPPQVHVFVPAGVDARYLNAGMHQLLVESEGVIQREVTLAQQHEV